MADAIVSLQEFATSAGQTLRVDRDRCMVLGVKILGLHSQNDGGKREYSPKAIAEAVQRYEGAAVFVDHGIPGKSRSYEDRNGRLVNVRATNEGLFGDHAYNPKHRITEQYLYDAEHAPGNVGFSHDAEGTTVRKDGKVIVESITKVNSVDLVARPATNKTLFESDEIAPEQREFVEHGLSAVTDARGILLGKESQEVKKARLTEILSVWQTELTGVIQPQERTTMEWKDITVASLQENRKDLYEQITGTDAVSKLNEQIKSLTEQVAAKDVALKDANDKLAANEQERAKQALTIAINEELKAAKLDPSNKTLVSEAFLSQLYVAPDASARKVLIEDRLALVKLTESRNPQTPPFAPVGGTAQPGTPAKTRDEFMGRL